MSGAQAGEHISVGTSKGRIRFAKAMTVAALGASVLGFAGAAPGEAGDENAVPDVGVYTLDDQSDFARSIGRGNRVTQPFTGAITGSVLSGQNKKIIRLTGA